MKPQEGPADTGGSPLSDPGNYPASWLFPMTGEWLEAFRRDVRRARDRGMRDGVFAKVGDSNLLGYNSFYGLGSLEPVWGEHVGLRPVMKRYREIGLPPGEDVEFIHCPDRSEREPFNSFSRISAATMMGVIARHLTTPPEEQDQLPRWWREDPDRLEGENAIETEIRLVSPLYALVLIGTNGQSHEKSPEETAEAVGDVVERIRDLGPVPVVFTLLPQLDHEALPGRWEFARRTNELICELAARERFPLFNQGLAMVTGDLVNYGLVVNDGIIFDGFHLDTFGGTHTPGGVGRSVDFRPEALRYGANYRNLLLLKVLRDLDQAAG